MRGNVPRTAKARGDDPGTIYTGGMALTSPQQPLEAIKETTGGRGERGARFSDGTR